MGSTNVNVEAVDAAAERRLGQLRDKRIAAAEATLAKARERLAAAQQADERAARSLGMDDWDGSRKAVLAAKEEVTYATALREDAERQLERAKARHTSAQVKSMRALVTAERAAATFGADIEPDRARITDLAREMALAIRSLWERIGMQHSHFAAQRHALDELGQPTDGVVTSVPSPHYLAGEAIARGLQAVGFAAYDFKDCDPTAASRPKIPLPGAQAVLADPKDHEARNARWQASLHAEAEANSARHNAAARGQPAPVIAPARPVRPAPAPNPFGDRISLAEE